jgi:predicted PurR-regulated permease PerM
MFALPPAARIGLYVLLLLAGVFALHLAQSVIVPLLVALLLATVLGPGAVWLQQNLKIRWSLACVTVVVLLVLANLMIFVVFSSAVTGVVARMSNEEKIIEMYKKLRNNMERYSPVKIDEDVFPIEPKNETQINDTYRAIRQKVEEARSKDKAAPLDEERYPKDPKTLKPAQISEKYRELRANLEKFGPPLDEKQFPKDLRSVHQIRLFQYLTDAAPYLLGQATLYSANWSWQVILILFTTFFVLLEGKMLARRVVAIFGPSEEVQSNATAVLLEMAAQVRTYLVWRTIINLGLAVVMGVIFQLFGLGQAWTWALLLAILNYIPYFGPVLAAIPPLLDAFISIDNPVVPLIIMALYWGVIVIEGWLIVPLLMGRSMDLNATTVMLACLFWPLVWGPTGLFLAMPIMAGIKAILYNMPDLRVWAELMSTTEVEERPQIVMNLDATNGHVPHPDGPAPLPPPRETGIQRADGDLK